ncbi:hypothetical protein [Gillisia sp. Hel1_33_143]|uniref:hypothetical protein n=1 Tax=Gillisia sp. Hel1_33_143 TaxID=1336796 RepID=UPI000B847596|nr:hypothetical protein [Gillisia sp. Hel1_33_143]
MKKILLISIILMNLACNEKTSEIRYYPNFEISNNDKVQKMILDTTQMNFKKITNWIGNNQYNGILSILEFEDNKITKRIIPSVRGNGLIKQRNMLSITTDSILIDNGYPISELKRILKRHYLNNNNIPYYSESAYKAAIEITIDTSQSGAELKKILTKLTRDFDQVKNEVKDSIKLRFLFSYLRQMPPPPPPPKSENNY